MGRLEHYNMMLKEIHALGVEEVVSKYYAHPVGNPVLESQRVASQHLERLGKLTLRLEKSCADRSFLEEHCYPLQANKDQRIWLVPSFISIPPDEVAGSVDFFSALPGG